MALFIDKSIKQYTDSNSTHEVELRGIHYALGVKLQQSVPYTTLLTCTSLFTYQGMMKVDSEHHWEKSNETCDIM